MDRELGRITRNFMKEKTNKKKSCDVTQKRGGVQFSIKSAIVASGGYIYGDDKWEGEQNNTSKERKPRFIGELRNVDFYVCF